MLCFSVTNREMCVYVREHEYVFQECWPHQYFLAFVDFDPLSANGSNV